MTTVTNLGINDAWVLNSVFNPENSLVQPKVLVNPDLSYISPGPHLDLTALRQAEIAAIRPLDCPDPSRTLIETAVAELTNLISAHPTYASAYNNRAQALALLGESATTCTIWTDTSTAIRLASPPLLENEVSQLQGAILAAAHTQRAKLLWKTAQSKPDSCVPSLGLSGSSQAEDLQWEDVARLNKHELEQLANRDFEMAGKYGNDDARKMGVLTNPYGKLCGGIVREAIREEISKVMVFDG
ncbi:uncharacterized protein BDR25DRAFT_289324 [Lindgomyces ingoldianus]|uniref:Uncharacterized protein n=1 Tax=Lindgomyces ingoldianus TaxID=673940 RepID=A0ACB6QQD6_9PLEO|nr:uncharacterized protein BDR25DRAFT_289324 [Lindgomyces ingoldianus]KAF2469121.1 hypothetical protein BDR25DRAFT_289324 [Lindgomyces ingoldianus]